MVRNALLLLGALLAPTCLGSTLYLTHYIGNVSVLTLDGSSLTQTSTVKACDMPAWLTYVPSSRTLYCSSREPGSLTTLHVSRNNQLTPIVRADAPSGGVASVLYGKDNGYIAIAHYRSSQISTFKLPLSNTSTPLQNFKFTMSKPGPNPIRQDAPHPHDAVLDPTGAFFLSPDLGADIVRIYAIDKASGQLTECPALITSPGAGPRHAKFWKASSDLKLYVLNELGSSVSAYSVTYPSTGCLSFNKTQELTAFPNNQTAPVGAKAGEIRIKDRFIYTTNRNDKSFSGNDSIATFSLSSTGAMTFQSLTQSYGSYPRTLDINKAGNLVAIGDQTSANVAIVKRNTRTGALGSLVANLRIGPAGTPEVEDGLSAVIWSQ